MPLFAYFDTSGISDLLLTGNTHVLIVGDSISSPESTTRLPAGIMREWGVLTAPCVGVVCSRYSGVSDNYGRSFPGTSNSAGILFKPGPGVRIAVSGGAGTPVLGQTVTESVSGATGTFLQELADEWWIAYDTSTNIAFTGGQTLTASGSGATRTGAAVVAMTTDHLGLPMNIFPMPHVLQYATGDVVVSTNIYNSQSQNENVYPQGDPWASLPTMARGIYYRHLNAFNIKGRSLRNAAYITNTNHDQRGAENAIATLECDLGSGAGIPVKFKWEGLGTSEVGQFTKFGGALFYRVGAAMGFSIDSVSVGGDGIASCVDTARCSDVHYAGYLTATRRPEATTLVVVLWYGQNDGAMNQATFETNLESAINRFTLLGVAAGYTTVKFIIVASYNTGGAHLSGKRDACYNVAGRFMSVAAFVNLYDAYSADYVANALRTSDGIHPTLAFSQEIAADIAAEIATPTETDMPIERVQFKDGSTTSAASLAIAMTSGLTLDSGLVVSISIQSDLGYRVTSVVGSSAVAGAAIGAMSRLPGYPIFVDGFEGGAILLDRWAKSRLPGNATANTITATFSGTCAAAMVAEEFSEIARFAPHDRNVTNTATATSCSTGTTAATSEADELWSAAWAWFGDDALSGVLTNSFANVVSVAATGECRLVVGHKVVAATGTAESTATKAGAEANIAAGMDTFLTEPSDGGNEGSAVDMLPIIAVLF